MNKKLQFLAISLLVGLMATAQTTIYEQTFESTSFPTDWSRTTLGTGATAGWRQGTNTSLQSNSWPIPANTRIVATNDDACNCDLSADTLKSPVLDFTGQNIMALSFDLFFLEGTYQGATENAKLLSSNDGGTTWSELEVFTGASSWRAIVKDISSFAGATNVRFAIVYNDGGGFTFGCAIDDFKVFVPLNFDVSTRVDIATKYVGLNQPIQISGTISNFGSNTITSATINYSVDGGTLVSEILTGLNITPLTGTATFVHPTNYIPTTLGDKSFVVFASNLNGSSPDQNTTNDNSTDQVTVISQTSQRVTLLEGFTSSTCPPCASLYNFFDPTLSANNPNQPGSTMANIKYQLNFPSPGNDPSYNPDADARRSYYGVSGIPDSYYDGTEAVSYTQTEINNYKSKLAPSKLECTYTTNASGKITTNVKFTPYITSTAQNKLFIAVLEKQYNYAASTTSQDVFRHVMRKMLPDGQGILLPAFSIGTEDSYTREFDLIASATPNTPPAQGSFNLWSGLDNLEVVAFVQNVTTKEIYQAAIGTFYNSTNLEERGLNYDVNLFPNPVANDLMIALDVKNSQMTNIEIVNTLGQTIHSSNQGMISGSKVVRLDMSNFANGIYFAKVIVGGDTQTIKFNVAR